MRETDGRNGLLAEAPDQREIGRHHGDLAKLWPADGTPVLLRIADELLTNTVIENFNVTRVEA